MHKGSGSRLQGCAAAAKVRGQICSGFNGIPPDERAPRFGWGGAPVLEQDDKRFQSASSLGFMMACFTSASRPFSASMCRTCAGGAQSRLCPRTWASDVPWNLAPGVL